MTRLVGASRWFIIGPFVVEASLYGVAAAAISGTVVYIATFALRQGVGNVLDGALWFMKNYWYFAVGALVLVGVLIGVISALLAARKYLRAKA